jgi:small GTP-binding protein
MWDSVHSSYREQHSRNGGRTASRVESEVPRMRTGGLRFPTWGRVARAMRCCREDDAVVDWAHAVARTSPISDGDHPATPGFSDDSCDVRWGFTSDWEDAVGHEEGRGRQRSCSFYEDDDEVARAMEPAQWPEAEDTAEALASTCTKRQPWLKPRELRALNQGLLDASHCRGRIQSSDSEFSDDLRDRSRSPSPMPAPPERQVRVVRGKTDSVPSGARKVKILMLGDSGVGKSSLTLRFTEDLFNANTVGTVGVDYKACEVRYGRGRVVVQVWDTAGQERFHRITRAYYRGCHGIILVYDKTAPQTLENTAYWMKNIMENAVDGVHTCLLGNKADLVVEGEGSVLQGEGRAVADKYGVSHFETSAKTGVNVEAAYVHLVGKILSDPRWSHGPRRAAGGGSGTQTRGPVVIAEPLKPPTKQISQCGVS